MLGRVLSSEAWLLRQLNQTVSQNQTALGGKGPERYPVPSPMSPAQVTQGLIPPGLNTFGEGASMTSVGCVSLLEMLNQEQRCYF